MRNVSICFLLILIVIGCNNKISKKDLLVEAEFNVDKSLLEFNPLVDSVLNLSLNIPKGWIPLNPYLLKIVNTIVLVDEYSNAVFNVGFYNPQDTSFMLIIDLSNLDKSYLSNLHLNYKEVLNKNNSLENIQFQEFSHNLFRIEQYVLQNENVLNFKLICNNLRVDKQQKCFEVMYFINRNKINENIKSIESSIGSLKCLIY